MPVSPGRDNSLEAIELATAPTEGTPRRPLRPSLPVSQPASFLLFPLELPASGAGLKTPSQ